MPPSQVAFAVETEIEKGHGRVELRQCSVTEDIAWLRERHPQWQQLKSVIELKSQREIKGEIAIEKRYYISSLPAKAATIANAVRQHWGIENTSYIGCSISFLMMTNAVFAKVMHLEI